MAAHILNRLGDQFIVRFCSIVGIENKGSATTVHGIVKRYVDCICTLRIAQNYCKLQWFVKVRMCGRSRLEVKCSSKSLRKPLHICVAQEEALGKWF